MELKVASKAAARYGASQGSLGRCGVAFGSAGRKSLPLRPLRPLLAATNNSVTPVTARYWFVLQVQSSLCCTNSPFAVLPCVLRCWLSPGLWL